MTNNLACFIPARSGSQRIKNKNMQNFGGTTLLRKAINTAKASRLFENIIVSTDGDAIENHVKEFDNEIFLHKRPEELAASDAIVEDSIMHWLLELRKQKKLLPEVICLLHVTSPFVDSSDLTNAHKLLIKNSNLNSIVYGYKLYPFLWEINNDKKYLTNPHYLPEKRPRTQNMKEYFCETGGFYFFRTKPFLDSNCRIIPPVGYYQANPNAAIHDINTQKDLEQSKEYFGYISEKNSKN